MALSKTANMCLSAGFSLPGFKAEALRLYEEVCQAVADNDKSILRQVWARLLQLHRRGHMSC